jgi:pimeloyl-ACP methyl ester carboxylesterase
VQGRTRAAVICNPVGAEYVYAHRSLRHLASRLAQRGFHVLRFDYYGTGDSAGNDADASIDAMQEDVEFAIEAARDIAGVNRVTLIGLRLGAAIASRAAARQPDEVESLVLWDPLDAPAVPEGLAARSLLVTTDPAGTGDDAGPAVQAPRCWEQSITTSGALPVAAFQRIEEWLR